MKRILIVADGMGPIRAARRAMRQTSGFRVVGVVDGRRSVRGHLSKDRPDVVLVDEMDDPDRALARLREVAASAPHATSLLLTADTSPEWLYRALDAGATSVVSKSVHAVALGTLLGEISRGSLVARRPLRARPAVSISEPQLTSRELEVLRLVTHGLTNCRIARELWVTEQTVKFHLSNVYRKLGVANRTEASRYAHVNHLVAPHEPVAS